VRSDSFFLPNLEQSKQQSRETEHSKRTAAEQSSGHHSSNSRTTAATAAAEGGGAAAGRLATGPRRAVKRTRDGRAAPTAEGARWRSRARPQRARDGGAAPGRGEHATVGPRLAAERATGRTREGESRRAAELQASATGRARKRAR
jgi:hypothetical protein